MNKRLLFVLFFVLMTVSAVVPASAQSDGPRVALVIGNANYPDADSPLKQPVSDARALADELKRGGFEVQVGENLTKEAMQRAIEGFYGKIKSGSSAVLFFSGFGIQTGRTSYLIPINAQIWTEAEVRRDGFNVDQILAELNSRGAAVKIAILDASRRNPFERRFRGLSTGLAPVTVPKGSLIISAAAPSTVVNESENEGSLFVRELLKEMRSPGLTTEEIFNRTRIGVSRASKGEQVPWISSSLVDEFYLNRSTARPPDSSPAVAAVEPPSRPPAKPEPESKPPASTEPASRPQAKTEPESKPPARAEPASRPAPSSEPAPKPTANADVEMRQDFEFAERVGTKKAYEDFLAQYSTGSYATLAREKLAKLDSPAPKQEPAPKPSTSVAALPQPSRPAPPETKPQPKPEPKAAVVTPSEDPLIAELSQAIRANPEDVDAYYKRGLAYAQKGEYPFAIKDFDQVIRINPKDSEAFNNRCWSRAMLGDLQVALRDCNEALKIKPNFVDALDSRGLVNLKIGLPNSAIADYNAALKQNPKHASALFGRGKAKLRNGDTAGGNADLAAAKAINPDIAEEFVGYGIK